MKPSLSDPGEIPVQCGLQVRFLRSDRSNFGKPLDCVVVVPTDGGFPSGRRLLSDFTGVAVETSGVVGQHQVKIGDVNVRLECWPAGGEGMAAPESLPCYSRARGKP